MLDALRRYLHQAWRSIVETFHIYGEIDGEQRAAAFAYYVLFSLIPLFALLLTVGSLFFSAHDVSEAIKSFLPLDTEQQKFIWETVRKLEHARGSVSLISGVVLIWCSLRFFQALVRGVNRAWHTVEIPWWQVPLKNFLMVLITASALLAGLFIPALMQGARDALLAAENFLHIHFPQFNLHLVSSALDLGRYLLGGLVLFYSFIMLYKVAPRRRILFRQIWLPSLLVTVALQMCQIAFVNILPRFVNYIGIYASVGVMMMLLLWVYTSGIIIILGGCLCAAITKVAEESLPVPPQETIPSSPEN